MWDWNPSPRNAWIVLAEVSSVFPVDLEGSHLLISPSQHVVQLLLQCQSARRKWGRQLQAVGKVRNCYGTDWKAGQGHNLRVTAQVSGRLSVNPGLATLSVTGTDRNLTSTPVV